MRRRRAEVQALLGPDERVFSMSCCPRLGCPKFSFPELVPGKNIEHRNNKFSEIFYCNAIYSQTRL